MKSAIIIFIVSFIAVSGWSLNPNLYIPLVNDSSAVQLPKEKSTYDLRKNSIYWDFLGEGILSSVSYDRILPVANRSAIILGLTIGFLGDIVPNVNYLYGSSKNFLEAGIGYSFPEQLVVPQVGYRYQGSKGFLFRAGGMYFASTAPDSFGDFPWF
ncbi:MAG: hypothetical protein MI922_13340, partial [Bacteroidales bacterium]|nr:hypothetical protein [Bacteroidales bacterium]